MAKTGCACKQALAVMLVFLSILLSSCATAPEGNGAPREHWGGQLNGMIEAELAFFLTPAAEGQADRAVNGNFAGNIVSVAGGHGSGTMNGSIKGRVENGVFKARLSGFAKVSAGSATIIGQMTGRSTDAHALGDWTLDARSSEGVYRFSGQWRAARRGQDQN